MEAIYFLPHRLSLSTRPSLATHRSPSCHGHQQNHVLNFHKHQSSFHGLTQMGMSAKRNPSSLTIVACTYAAKEDDNNDVNKIRRTLQRAYSFNTLTKGSQALDKFLNIQERARARDPSESVKEFRQNLEKPRCNLDTLQELAWELEMSGEEEKAVQMLKKKLSYIERERDMRLGEKALIFRRVLVELLIDQDLASKLETSGEEAKAVQMLMMKLSDIERERDMPLGEKAIINLRRLLVELLIDQESAWKLETSGEEAKAVQMLRKKLSDIERERDMPLGEEELILSRLLVELLIYQGKYCNAKLICENLIGQGKPSLKSYLYLAIIYQLTGDTKNSEDTWDTFQSAYAGDNLSGFIPISDGTGDEINDVNATSFSMEKTKQFTEITDMSFTDFQNHIEELREEIKRGRDHNR